ncbi:MAG: GntR family transcriptional regulator, partial [Beijerinckiaceae bacterium]
GQLASGSYLPNEYELARELEVSIGTIRKAVDLLAEKQMVVRQQGKGTLVSDRRWSVLHERLNRIRFERDAQMADWRYTQLAYEMKPAGEEVANFLRMDPLDPIHYIHDLREFPPNSKGHDFIHIPVSQISDIRLRDQSYPTIIRLAREYRIVIGEVDERLYAVAADALEAKMLSIAEGSPIFKRVRVIYTSDGTPLEYRLSFISTPDGYYWAPSD